MTKDWLINHVQDEYDALSDIKGMKLPYRLMMVSQRPRDGTEGEKWDKLNSFFHRGVVPVFSKVSGYREDEAKELLQTKFALVEEHLDYYLVESISGMSNTRLIEFIESCIQFLAMTFGERVDKMLIENRNKYLKTKRICR